MTNVKIMLVDDEERFLSTTQKLMKKKGYDTLIASSGNAALELLGQKQVHVVILDVKMPEMDGIETLKEIKKQHPMVEVIMLTGHGALPSAMEALEKGAFDYLSKPCDIELLAAKVREACHQSETVFENQEKRVHEAMVPIEAYTTLSGDQRVQRPSPG